MTWENYPQLFQEIYLHIVYKKELWLSFRLEIKVVLKSVTVFSLEMEGEEAAFVELLASLSAFWSPVY